MELIPLTYILCVTIIGLFMHCPHGSHDAYKKENTQSRYCQNSQLLKDMEAAFNLHIHTSNLALQVNGRTLKQGLTIYVLQLFCALYMHCKIIIIPCSGHVVSWLIVRMCFDSRGVHPETYTRYSGSIIGLYRSKQNYKCCEVY